MFRWVDHLGMAAWVDSARSRYAHMESELPAFIIFSIPFALLVSAAMTFHHAIWWEPGSWTYRFWFWCVPLSAIGSELLQRHEYIPGTFDHTDLVAIFTTTALTVGLVKAHSLVEISKERTLRET